MRLAEQLQQLDSALLGRVITEFPEPLDASEQAFTHGYLVLAHAVLEEHLEKIFEDHYDRLAGWLVADMVPLEAARFVYAVRDWLPDAVHVSYKRRNLRGLVSGGARKEFLKIIKQNHGLKLQNVENLGRLVGLDWQALEDSLNSELSDLSTLGTKRGVAGHLSPYTAKVTDLTANDYPEDIRGWVEAGRIAVEAIETYLRKLVEDQQPASLIRDWDGN